MLKNVEKSKGMLRRNKEIKPNLLYRWKVGFLRWKIQKKKRKKNTISRVNNRLETKEGKISKLEDLATEVIYYETQT